MYKFNVTLQQRKWRKNPVLPPLRTRYLDFSRHFLFYAEWFCKLRSVKVTYPFVSIWQRKIFQSTPSYFAGCKPPTGIDNSGVWKHFLYISVQFNGLAFILGNANLFLCSYPLPHPSFTYTLVASMWVVTPQTVSVLWPSPTLSHTLLMAHATSS